MFVNYNRPEKEVIIDLIRRDNGDAELHPNWVTFDTPIAAEPTPDVPRNTSVWVRSVPGSRYSGDREFFYNRRYLQEFVNEWSISEAELRIRVTSQLRSSELSSDLTEIFGILITPEMVLDELLPVIPLNGDVPYVLKLRLTNLCVMGNVTLTLYR